MKLPPGLCPVCGKPRGKNQIDHSGCSLKTAAAHAKDKRKPRRKLRPLDGMAKWINDFTK